MRLNQPQLVSPPTDGEPSEVRDLTLRERLGDMMTSAMPDKTPDYYHVKELQPHHIPWFMLRVEGGLTLKEIAQIAGVTHIAVRNVFNSAPGRELMIQLYKEQGIQSVDVFQTFRDVAPIAAEIVLSIAQDSEKDETRLKAAFSILDRAGYGATKKVEQTITTPETKVSKSQMGLFLEALRESEGLGNGTFEIVGGDPVEPEG